MDGIITLQGLLENKNRLNQLQSILTGCDDSFHLFDSCALLFVSIVGQFEVLCNVVVPGCLLDLNLLCELEDFLLQLGDRLLSALRVRGRIFNSRERTVRPTGNGQRRLSQPTHLQPVDLRWLGEKKRERLGWVKVQKGGVKQGIKEENKGRERA